MRTERLGRLRLLGVLAMLLPLAAHAASYQQVVDGVAIYFGIVPAELVRGHPREHPESGMHGGTPVGESHLMVALFDAKTGARVTEARITANVTGDGRAKLEKQLEPMTVAGALTFGNYFSLTGSGPYRIDLHVFLPGRPTPIRAHFEWARS